MRKLMIACVALMIVLGAAVGAAAQNEGATIMFKPDGVKVYRGVGDAMLPCPPGDTVEVGNFRIIRAIVPSQASFTNQGLVFPWRGALDEEAANLDASWGNPRPLMLLCEIIDTDEPIGFRMRAEARRRGRTWSWLDLGLGRGPAHDNMMMVEGGRRWTGGMHTWYAQVEPSQLYGNRAPEQRFVIALDPGGRGSWFVQKLELKSWPTVVD